MVLLSTAGVDIVQLLSEKVQSNALRKISFGKGRIFGI